VGKIRARGRSYGRGHGPAKSGHVERRLVFLLLHLETFVPDDKTVHGFDGLQGRIMVVVADETKAPGATRYLVHHDARGDDLSERGEHLQRARGEEGP